MVIDKLWNDKYRDKLININKIILYTSKVESENQRLNKDIA